MPSKCDDRSTPGSSHESSPGGSTLVVHPASSSYFWELSDPKPPVGPMSPTLAPAIGMLMGIPVRGRLPICVLSQPLLVFCFLPFSNATSSMIYDTQADAQFGCAK